MNAPCKVTGRSPGLSVVIPAYRSPGTLGEICDLLDLHVAPLVEELEVIFVDDGSGDGTWDSIRELAASRPWVRGMTMLRNYGQHNALLAGMRAARMPLVLTMDDDLQNPPDQVNLLLDALTDEIDLVYGRPVSEAQSLARNLASRLTKRTLAISLGPDVHPRISPFRLFRRDLLKAGDEVQDPHISIDVILSWATSRIVDIPVEYRERKAGRSGYSLGRLFRHTMTMITGYSTRPLRWVSGLGFLAAGFGFAMLLYVLVTWIGNGGQVPGFTFLAAALCLFSGVQLLSLGVVGEYVGRMHFRSMGKPPYVVRAVTPPVTVGADTADPTDAPAPETVGDVQEAVSAS